MDTAFIAITTKEISEKVLESYISKSTGDGEKYLEIYHFPTNELLLKIKLAPTNQD